MEYLDEKTAMAVERRRRMEEERKQRIFNEKVRSKGVCYSLHSFCSQHTTIYTPHLSHLSTTHNSRFTTYYSLLISHSLTTHHSPLTTHHSPLTTHHLYRSTCWVLKSRYVPRDRRRSKRRSESKLLVCNMHSLSLFLSPFLHSFSLLPTLIIPLFLYSPIPSPSSMR